MKPVAQIRVLYIDTDQMHVVNNAAYLRYFEIGRAELLRARGTPYKKLEESGFHFPVVEATLRYRGPARYDDLLDIECDVDDLRAATVAFRYVIRKAGDPAILCEGSTRHACVDAGGKLRRFPDSVLALLRPQA